MGINTVVPAGMKRYNRRIPPKSVMSAARLLARYKDRMQPPVYDIITHDPLISVDEKIDEQIETIRFLSDLPHPRIIVNFNLTLFPGARLNDYARKKDLNIEGREGYNDDRRNSLFIVEPLDLYDLLFHASIRGLAPKCAVNLLAHPVFRKLNRLNPKLTRAVVKFTLKIIDKFKGSHAVYLSSYNHED